MFLLIWYLSSANSFFPISPKRLSSQHPHDFSSSLTSHSLERWSCLLFHKIEANTQRILLFCPYTYKSHLYTVVLPSCLQPTSSPMFCMDRSLPSYGLLLIITFPFNLFFIPGFMVSSYIISIYISYTKIAHWPPSVPLHYHHEVIPFHS